MYPSEAPTGDKKSNVMFVGPPPMFWMTRFMVGRFSQYSERMIKGLPPVSVPGSSPETGSEGL